MDFLIGLEVNVVSRPKLMETAVVQKWAVDFGCTLFIIGSALLAAISALDLLEDMLTCGAMLGRLCKGFFSEGQVPNRLEASNERRLTGLRIKAARPQDTYAGLRVHRQ